MREGATKWSGWLVAAVCVSYSVFLQSETRQAGCRCDNESGKPWINQAAASALAMVRSPTAAPTNVVYASPAPSGEVKRRVDGDETHAATLVVPVFTFGTHSQMRLMLSDWLLEGTSVLTSDGKLPSVRLDFKAVSSLRDRDILAAFKEVNTSRPHIALWMFIYKDGDPWFNRSSSLRFLGDLFKESSEKAGVHHGVFHWTPEFCNVKGVTFENTRAAYEYVDFVFMFAYVDERLASLNKTKYLPFPLGPALWRKWQKPATVNPTLTRPLIAAYRGSASTRKGELQKMRESLHVFDEGERSKVVLEERTVWTMSDTPEDHERYLHLLSTARFAVAPPGHNPNSYRVAEACESGSTPVILLPWRGCYRNWAALYGHPQVGATNYGWIPKAPFIVLNGWPALGQKLKERFSEQRDEAAELLSWYEAWRKAFRNKLLERIHAVLP